MTYLISKVDDSWIWHKNIFHINFDDIVKVSTTFAIKDLPKILKPTNMMCKQCVLVKQRKSSLQSTMFTTLEKLVIVHINLSGPTRKIYFYCERYCMLLIDDLTRMMWVAFIRDKSKAFKKLKISLVELG